MRDQAVVLGSSSRRMLFLVRDQVHQVAVRWRLQPESLGTRFAESRAQCGCSPSCLEDSQDHFLKLIPPPKMRWLWMDALSFVILQKSHLNLETFNTVRSVLWDNAKNRWIEHPSSPCDWFVRFLFREVELEVVRVETIEGSEKLGVGGSGTRWARKLRFDRQSLSYGMYSKPYECIFSFGT